jgi:hypothetical protein
VKYDKKVNTFLSLMQRDMNIYWVKSGTRFLHRKKDDYDSLMILCHFFRSRKGRRREGAKSSGNEKGKVLPLQI